MNKVICWWSGGVTSAVACKVAINIYGKQNCEVIMIDTKNEHEDTYRFKSDCEKWYGINIDTISAFGKDHKYDSIQDVWFKNKSLNVATGAICSTVLKRKVREDWQKQNEYKHQVFGFEFNKDEMNRALSMKLNHPKSKPIFPLLMLAYSKKDCLDIVEEAGIEIPIPYELGFRNNNCFQTGCVQGGVGYWQKMKRDFPAKFDAMAKVEHDITDIKGEPVTMLKDQSKEAMTSGNILVFLKKHKDYPQLKCIDDMPPCKVEPLMECNGFCGVNDMLPVNPTQFQLNF